MRSLAIKFRARIKKCHQRRIRNEIERRHRTKKNDKQIFEKTIDAFFANDFDRKSAEEYIFTLFDDMID
jgi:formate dehydrogenase maturation protein FdhE